MAASSSCNLIDYQAYRENKRLAVFNKRRRTGFPGPQEKQTKNTPCDLLSADLGRNFDHQLLAYENSARCMCLKIYKNLSLEKLPGGLEQMLTCSILPSLQRIGFDKPIAKMLFEIAPLAWKLLAPTHNKSIPFQPLINREIEAVQQAFEFKFDDTNVHLPRSASASPAFIPGSINETNFPAHLFKMLNQIATPWIILPRAFRFLQRDQCRYLPVYLKILDAEKRESCLKLFSRITVEFMGNFSFKFADSRFLPDELSKLLFYGYAALFWKTLRCPPRNLENSALFDHFFKWIKRFASKNDSLGKQEKSIIDQMVQIKTRAFPTLNTQSFRNRQLPDSSRFLVTLRHGRPGIAATLRYFGIDQFLKTRRTGNRFTCLSFQKELLCLLIQIRTHYRAESKPTRENIRQFINWIKAACANAPPDFNHTQRQFVDRLLNHMQRFVQA